MLALSNTYFLQSHTELTSFPTVRESHVQAFVPNVVSYTCLHEHAQFAHNIAPAACYPCAVPQPQHTATILMNFSGSRQSSAVRSPPGFENDANCQTFTSTNHGFLSQSRNLPSSKCTLQGLSNSEHQNNLKTIVSFGNVTPRNYSSHCSRVDEITFHNMAKMKSSVRSQFHGRLLSPFHIQNDDDSHNPLEEHVNTGMFAEQNISGLDEEDSSCYEEDQQTHAQYSSPSCRKLNHSIASILNISSGHFDNQICTNSKRNQETENSSNVCDDNYECSKTSDILVDVDDVISEQSEYFGDDLGIPDRNGDVSSVFQNTIKRGHSESKDTDNMAMTPKSSGSSNCDSIHSEKEFLNLRNTEGVHNMKNSHNNQDVPRVNISSIKTKAQEASLVQNINVVQDANKEVNSIKNSKWPWFHDKKERVFTADSLPTNALTSACGQVPFVNTTTSATMLPPFHTLSQLHRKGTYDKGSAFKPVSKLPVSLPQFPDYLVPYGSWTDRGFLPQNMSTSGINRQENMATVYSSSEIYPKCINNFTGSNSTFDNSAAKRQTGSFYQRHGITDIVNSSAAVPTNEIVPDNLDRWMAWLRKTDAHSTTPTHFDERMSSRAAPPPRYHCDYCNRTYSTFGGLSKHRQFHCSQHVKKEFSCKVCNRAYSSLGALKMHIRTHTLPCKCHECGKAFSRPWLLQGHLRTHTGEKPFKCSHCGRAFADRSNLRAHLQTHAEIKRYACSKCGKTFSRMSLLTKHTQGSCLANMKHR